MEPADHVLEVIGQGDDDSISLLECSNTAVGIPASAATGSVVPSGSQEQVCDSLAHHAGAALVADTGGDERHLPNDDDMSSDHMSSGRSDPDGQQ